MTEICHYAYKFAPTRSQEMRLVALLIASIFAVSTPVWASCPRPGSVGDEYARVTLVFVADVVSVRPAAGANRSAVITQITFKVLERLKGMMADRTVLALEPSSEEFEYAVGQRVLVYARRMGTTSSTACTRTKALWSLQDSELDTLRGLRNRPPSESVVQVTSSAYLAGRALDTGGQPLSGVFVTATPTTGGISRSARTRADGRYLIGALMDGVYRLDFDLPGFDLTRRNHVQATSAETIASVDAVLRVSAVCECIVRTTNQEMREHQGQVLDTSGAPLPHARLQLADSVPEVAYADGRGRFSVLLPLNEPVALTASDSGFQAATQRVSGSGKTPIVFRLVHARAVRVDETEQMRRGCRCPGNLFTHAGRN